MAATPWPAGLPSVPLAAGFARSSAADVASFQPDVGPPLLRRRGSIVQQMLTWSFNMSLAQLNLFETFYITTLAHGTGRFSFRDPHSGRVHDYQCEGPYTIGFTDATHAVVGLTVRRVT